MSFQPYLFEMASTIINSISQEDGLFFVTKLLQAFFTKQLTSSAIESDSLYQLTQIDHLTEVIITKLSNLAFLQTLIDRLDSPATVSDDFFLEEFITDHNISDYITQAYQQARRT